MTLHSRRHAPSPCKRLGALTFAVIVLGAAGAHAECGFGDPVVSPWILNTDGHFGQSPNATINAVVSAILADVQRVRFTPTDVYVEATGVPTYPVGPFPDGNPAIPYDQHWLFRI